VRGARAGSIAGARRRPAFIRSPWRGRAIGFSTAALAIVATLIFAPAWIIGTTRIVAAYDVAAVAFTSFFWLFAMQRKAENTAVRSALEDPGRNVVLALVLACVGFGLAATIVILGKGPHVATAGQRDVSYAVAIVAIIVGWFLIHTMFVFRYAHLYYFDSDDDGSAQRGLVFPGTTNPNDFDFAYFSFVIGMTFQVSDVQIKDPGVRRIALFHALISFGYNTAIVALVINIVSGLLHA